MKQITDFLLLAALFGVIYFVVWKQGMIQTEITFNWRQDHDKLIQLEKRVSEMESKK
jgi:hypothetical protein